MQIQIPTDAELEILQILWMNGPATVRFINDTINKNREVGYTSTLKIMQIMMDKGLIVREIIERTHYYTAAVDEESTQSHLLDEFVENAFRGSTSTLVMRMLGSGITTQKELEEIKKMIARMEEGNNNKSL